MQVRVQGRIEKIQKEEAESPTRMKTSLFRTCTNKVIITFQKHFANTRKKGGGGAAAPSPPPLNPPMVLKPYTCQDFTCYVLGQNNLLSQCLTSPRCINDTLYCYLG